MEPVFDRATIEPGLSEDESALADATNTTLAVGENVKSAIDHLGKKFRAPASSVENDRHAPSWADSSTYLLHDLGKHLGHCGVGGGGDDIERIASFVVHPVVDGRGESEPHARDIGFLDLALTVVDADVAIDVEKTERATALGNTPAHQLTPELLGSLLASQASELTAQGFHLGSSVQTNYSTQIGRRKLLECLGTVDPQKCKQDKYHDGCPQPIESRTDTLVDFACD